MAEPAEDDPRLRLLTLNYMEGVSVIAMASRVLVGEVGKLPRSSLTTQFMRKAEALGVRFGIRDPKVILKVPPAYRPDWPILVEIYPWIFGERLEVEHILPEEDN